MKNKIQKTMLKARYIDLELQEVKEIYQECSVEWKSHVARLSGEHGVNSKDEDVKLNKCVKPTVSPKKKQPGVIMNMYRDIAKVVHPDVCDTVDQDSDRLMRQASKAKECGDMITLMNICDDLGIKTPSLRDTHLKYIQSDIDRKEVEMKQMKRSDAWIWYHSDEVMRLKIDDMIIKSLTK